jgi:hypothetical protein
MDNKIEIDWSKQHCGVHQSSVTTLLALMPDLKPVIDTFPDNPLDFTWDVKVHMLMPRQYPCIPNWHVDNVPRKGGVQQFDQVKLDLPMYLWVSNGPLTQFEHGYVLPQVWHKFNQADKHRGTMASEFCWRGFIRATHSEIQPYKVEGNLRRHCQVYLDAGTYEW